MSFRYITYTVSDKIATLTFNRPEMRNAIHWPMSAEISHALQEAERDPAVSVIIIRGAGSGFSSGYDLGPGSGTPPLQTGRTTATTEDGKSMVSVWDNRARVQGHIAYMLQIWDHWKPIIAQVHGECLGGASALALACDLMVASEDARIGHPGVRAIAPGEETAIFAWHVGMKKAKEMVLTGDALTAAQMLEYKMANYVVPNEALDDTTLRLAKRVANIDVELLTLSKRMINRVFEQQGFTFSMQSSGEFVTLAGRLPSNQEFKRIARESGLRAALQWRDGAFGGALGLFDPIPRNGNDE